MGVQVRHALTDPVVHGDERALRTAAVSHRSGEGLHPFEVRADLVDGQIGQRLDVPAWDEEDVTGKQRSVVEEAHDEVVVEHHLCR